MNSTWAGYVSFTTNYKIFGATSKKVYLQYSKKVMYAPEKKLSKFFTESKGNC